MFEVRLTSSEIHVILLESKQVFGSRLACVRLHGSRADLQKKGGDIDLVIELFGAISDKFELAQSLRQGLCFRLGEQKFDILILSVDPALNSERENTFFAIIFDSSKVLWSAHG